jgi:ABC-type sulfate/molybdate transport systems ATPase subunit
MNRSESRERAEGVLRLVRLDGLTHRTRRELSGGERQRVALARLLALEPEVLLLDEPTAHVDHANARLIEEIIQQLHATMGMTVILASHDLRQAQTLADRVVTLLDGQLFCGTMDNLFAGRLRAEDDGFTFRGEMDLLLRLAPETIVDEQPDGCVQLTETPIRIALDAERLDILPGQAASDCQLAGTIESVHQRRDRCRVVVRLQTSQQVTATLPQSDYARLGLNVGSRVCLRLAEGALRVIQTRS